MAETTDIAATEKTPMDSTPRSFSPGRAASICGIVVALASLTGALFPAGSWYAGLDKPPGTPPDHVFPIVWTALYIGMAIAAWRVWRRRGIGRELGLFVLQLALNAAWMPAAFGAHRLGLALLVAIALWVVIGATIRGFWRADRLAALLLTPYFAWMAYVVYLNAALLGLN